jgi:putative CocE/NonD family hydrolase
MWGISYPGFYTAAALPEAHPALVAASPQAPIADFFFDDFHHNGAYTLAYFLINPVFGHQKTGDETEAWWESIVPGTPDGYKFLLNLGPLRNARKFYGDDNFFWKEIVDHPNYDTFWQGRSILPHLKGLHTAVLTVGGWFDAEDLYGPLQIYKTIERECPGLENRLVMGPWSHGDWARAGDGQQAVGDIVFGEGLSKKFQEEVEARFFRHHLKGADESGKVGLPEALTFDTGRREWKEFDQWPPAKAEKGSLYFGDRGNLVREEPGAGDEEPFTEYVSDPRHPVPDLGKIWMGATPREYMTGDQRFATRRPDVVTFVTDPLDSDMTLAGEITARLWVSTTGTDSDWIVKLIDVYPPDVAPTEARPGVVLGEYEQLVRGEIMRGRFRNSFETPEPFVAGEPTPVQVPLQDVFHTFRKGHRIQVSIQSSWFPLFDRNPQTFVGNIYEAEEGDFSKTTQRIHHDAEHPSQLEVRILADGGAEGDN